MTSPDGGSLGPFCSGCYGSQARRRPCLRICCPSPPAAPESGGPDPGIRRPAAAPTAGPAPPTAASARSVHWHCPGCAGSAAGDRASAGRCSTAVAAAVQRCHCRSGRQRGRGGGLSPRSGEGRCGPLAGGGEPGACSDGWVRGMGAGWSSQRRAVQWIKTRRNSGTSRRMAVRGCRMASGRIGLQDWRPLCGSTGRPTPPPRQKRSIAC